ncbi:MAG: type II toxin-antitoxin system VapC family toxin [Candidatus Helarchaeota archaeon]
MKLIDTNILVHAYNKDSPNRIKAKEIVEQLIKGKHVISVQNILEFYSAITKRVDTPLSPVVARYKAVNLYKSNAKKIIPNFNAILVGIRLAAPNDLKGGEIFDAILVATMLEYKISTIITENEAHFQNYPIEVENPFDGQS